MTVWKEITVYVHGITEKRTVVGHAATYQYFHGQINKALGKITPGLELGEMVGVEWGWANSSGGDRMLAEVERRIADGFEKAYRSVFSPTINPARLLVRQVMRPMFIFGGSDMFYYVSEEGKWTVRKTVFRKILSEMERQVAADQLGAGISLTFVGHSAGTVILHDLLYNIFSPYYRNRPAGVPAGQKIDEDLLLKMRSLAASGRIRLRRFYTLGSPITPMTFRSNTLVQKALAPDSPQTGFMNPEDIGLRVSPSEKLSPRWINFWNPNDGIAYPLRFLYNDKDSLIKDQCTGGLLSVLNAHGAYWRSQDVIQAIARDYAGS